MITLGWPWLLALAPLPWLLRRLLGSASAGAALRVPVLPQDMRGAARPVLRGRAGLAALAWLALVAAAVRPLAPASRAPAAAGGELMIALDVSASMATVDGAVAGRQVQRLEAARRRAVQILQTRPAKRVGLIVFGSQAYLHTPLTDDRVALADALDGVEVGLAGEKTALGDAIALALRHFGMPADPSRRLVVLSDGDHTTGTLTPQRAAWLAQREQLPVDIVSLGPNDPSALRALAASTDGRVVDAADDTAFARWLAESEARAQGTGPSPPAGARELYAWPLAAALLLCCVLLGSRVRGG